MKKDYIEPEITISSFSTEDVMTASGGIGGDWETDERV